MSSIDVTNSSLVADDSVPRTASRSARLPWYIWCALAGITSAQVGAYWDISWHESIGRDTFWTPAHIAIQLCGVLAAVAFGYLIFNTTFNRHAPLRESSVRILGLHGPIGAFIAGWGGIAMLTSAPFDDWWHNAYGLDVKIISPPHMVLFVGVYAILIGTAVLISGCMNRADPRARGMLRWLYLYCGAILLIGAMLLVTQLVSRTRLHNALPYIVLSVAVPIVFASTWRVTRFSFTATMLAAFYMAFVIALILILPLFPAQPKLGPVYQHITHFIPPQFPILLVVPALLIDLFWRVSPRSVWLTSLMSGFLYVLSLVAVEWPFASFLMSPASRNAFFGTGYLNYDVPPYSYMARGQFYVTDTPQQFAFGLAIAIALATITFRFGTMRGNWMASVKR
jgi:hypothetical protein